MRRLFRFLAQFVHRIKQPLEIAAEATAAHLGHIDIAAGKKYSVNKLRSLIIRNQADTLASA